MKKGILVIAMLFFSLVACKQPVRKTTVVDSVLIKNLRADSLALKGQPPHAPNDRHIDIDTTKAPRMTFAVKTYNFGTITQGRKIHRKYKFTNTGKAPLIITNAIGSCGCTVPTYSHKPIAPGASSAIDVTFSSVNTAPAIITQGISIYSNAYPNEAFLTINGVVKAAKKIRQ
jgi:hypothetical protein